jgi:hypothetical protein
MSPDKAAAQPSPKGRAAADGSSSSTDRIEFSRLAHKNLEIYPNSTGNLAGKLAMPWVRGSLSMAVPAPGLTPCGALFADDDKDGRRHASKLAGRIRDRGIEARFGSPQGAFEVRDGGCGHYRRRFPSDVLPVAGAHLRVEVDDHNFKAIGQGFNGQIDRRRRLRRATLLANQGSCCSFSSIIPPRLPENRATKKQFLRPL